MGLGSSLNAGVMGLAVNATKLATISDNIANSETFGYKRANVDFSSMVISQGNGSFTAGGVRSATFKDVAAQGSLISTNNSTDISVAGRGMLPVTTIGGLTGPSGDRPFLLTTTGSFSPDQDGFLRTLSGNFLLGVRANADGSIPTFGRNTPEALEPVQVTSNQFAASPTTRVNLGLNVPASSTESDGDGASFDLPVDYFDSLGRTQTINFVFTPQVPAVGAPATNTWDVQVFDFAGDPAVPAATFSVTFDETPGSGGSILAGGVTAGAGATYDETTGLLNMSVAFGPIDIVLGAPGDGGPLTQLSSSFSPVGVRSDGAPIGTLRSVEISEEGMVEAIFDTGFRRVLYQVPVVDVPNTNGLTAEDNQTFSVSQNSGDIYLWDAGEGPVGTTIGFALTESTTDVASELTDLIQTQRAYSSNARIVQTVDEMLEETTNLIR